MQFTTHAFDFPSLIHSHGWRFLAPNVWDEKKQALSRPLRFDDGGRIYLSLTSGRRRDKSVVKMETDRPLTKPQRVELGRKVSRMLSLDQDLSGFHLACESDALLRFVHERGAGRILRSPTAFEDVIKTVCTTNCSWQNTRSMCDKLCEIGLGDFPTPAEVLRYSPARLARRVPLGYRSRTVCQLARLSAAGKLPLDEWAAGGDFDRIGDALDSIWGIGPYARAHILMLLGDFSRIPVDCEVLKYLRETHFKGRKISAAKAVRPYAKYGRHQFLAFKFGRMARRMNYDGST